jgi:hypothetical protein
MIMDEIKLTKEEIKQIEYERNREMARYKTPNSGLGQPEPEFGTKDFKPNRELFLLKKKCGIK